MNLRPLRPERSALPSLSLIHISRTLSATAANSFMESAPSHSGSVIQANVSEDGESLAFVPGTGSIPAPRKHDNIARDAELLLTNFDLGLSLIHI